MSVGNAKLFHKTTQEIQAMFCIPLMYYFLILPLIAACVLRECQTPFKEALWWGYIISMILMKSIIAEPLLDNEGEILDGGADITVASIASYYQDVIYVCAFVQVACILTDKAFWAFWLLPLVLAFIIYSSIVKPLMQQYQTPKVQSSKVSDSHVLHCLIWRESFRGS